jgi:hypothetical protein
MQIIGRIGPPQVQVEGELSAQIVFAEYAERIGDPIVKFLKNLSDFTSGILNSFAQEFD